MRRVLGLLGIALCIGLLGSCTPATSTTTYTLTPGTLANGSMNPATATSVAADAATSIVATPATGYAFSSWAASPGANASFADASSASTTVTLSGDATITPTFTAKATTYTLTPGTVANGSMTPAAATSVAPGAATSIVATTAAGYVFSSWSASPAANASFASASSASTTVTLSGDATISPTFSSVYPTLALLTGTWKQSYSVTNANGSTDAYSITLAVSADGSFTDIEQDIKTTSGGTVTTSYSGTKGTLSLSGDSLTLSITHTSSSSTSATPSWSAVANYSRTKPAVIINGSLYWIVGMVGGPCSAQGAVSGLLGTWSTKSYSSLEAKPYEWDNISFAADGTYTAATYVNTTSVQPSTASSSSNGHYTTTNGVLTYDSSSTSSYLYAIYDSYLIIGPTSTSLGAWTKQ